jgi:P4 family phage/plasmid primase-like protien
MTSKNNISLIQREFVDFMKAHRIPKDDVKLEQTHTVMGELHPILCPYPGRFSITEMEYEKFLGLYRKLNNENNEDNDNKVTIHIVERPKIVGPVIVDIDIQIPEEFPERIYLKNHIKSIVAIYNEVIARMYDISKDHITAYVYEKDKPTHEVKERESYYKDGFHIYYNDIPFDVKDRYYIYDKTKEMIIKKDIFGDIPTINTYDTICDDSVIARNGILMSGSCKPGRTPYKLTRIFDYNLNEIPVKDYDIDELIDLKSIRRHAQDDAVHLKDPDDEAEIIEVYNSYTSKKTKNGIVNKKLIHNASEKLDFNKIKLKFGTTHDRKLAIELLEIINPKRFDEYNDWFHIGLSLHSISDDFYAVYDAVSSQSSKYQYGCCEKPWKQARDNNNYGYTINTIRWMALQDNRETMDRFNDIIRNSIAKSIKDAINSGTHEDVACVVKEFYEGRFKCVSIKENKWCQFQDNRWIIIESAHSLSDLVATDVRKEFAKMQSIIAMDIHQNEVTGVDTDETHKKFSNASKLFKSLGTCGFIDNVVKMTARKMFDSKFLEKLDENINLIGFTNGVFDLTTGVFRDGLPDDMICKTTGYDYKEYSMSSPEVKIIEKYFAEVFPKQHIRDYMLMFIASLFDGKVLQQQLFWTGTGANGKSTTVNLIRSALGEYSDGMSVSMITQKRKGANDASPEIANKKGIRFVVMQEPEKNDIINVGYMKELTGGDKIKARPLYGIPMEFVPQFTPILVCNIMPQLSDMDGGTARRVVVCEYTSEFVEKPDKHKPNQFKIDTSLVDKMKTWNAPFAWWILNIQYTKYKEANFKFSIPEEVKIATNEYKKDSDIYLEFVENNIERTKNEHDVEPVEFLYKLFKQYYRDSYEKQPPSKKEFLAYFKRNDYKMDGNKIIGLKLKDTYDN